MAEEGGEVRRRGGGEGEGEGEENGRGELHNKPGRLMVLLNVDTVNTITMMLIKMIIIIITIVKPIIKLHMIINLMK